MTVVYLKSSDTEILTLDSITSVEKSQSNSVTKSSVMSGKQASDGYTVGNPTIAFSGICTYSKLKRTNQIITPPTPEELDKIVTRMINSQTRFTMYGNALIPTMKDMVITDYRIMQDKYSNAITVSMALEQVFVSDAADVITISRPTKEAKPELPENSKSGSIFSISAAQQKERDDIIYTYINTARPAAAELQ